MNKTKLFTKNFTLMIIGQIISLFGNVILRFALSMFVLDKTGSVAAFATILAVSMIPTILLSSLGGILADRVNKRNIMVVLDFITALFILIFTITLQLTGVILVVGIMMVILSIIQAFYQPSVQSSIPCLVEENNLMSANGIVIQINALANLLGPIIGGFLYGFLGLFPILVISGICFFISAIMECFIKIPFIKQEKQGSFITIIKSDFIEAFHFLIKEQKQLFKLLLLIASLNLFLSAMIMVGLPYIIKILLGLSNQLYGFVEGAMGVGSIIGGILSGLLAKKLKFKKSYWLLIGASFAVFPIGIAILLQSTPMAAYAITLVGIVIAMAFSTLFTIYSQTIMQKLTPSNLLGKIASVVTVICMCAIPIGQAIYGLLFDFAGDKSFFVVFLSGLICMIIAVLSKRVLYKIEN